MFFILFYSWFYVCFIQLPAYRQKKIIKKRCTFTDRQKDLTSDIKCNKEKRQDVSLCGHGFILLPQFVLFLYLYLYIYIWKSVPFKGQNEKCKAERNETSSVCSCPHSLIIVKGKRRKRSRAYSLKKSFYSCVWISGMNDFMMQYGQLVISGKREQERMSRRDGLHASACAAHHSN